MKSLNYTIVAAVSILVASCGNFEGINTNPDAPTTAAPSMIATQVMKDAFRFFNPVPDEFLQGDNLMNKHTAVLNTNPNAGQYFYSWWPYGSFDSYAKLTDLKNMSSYAANSVNSASYQGLELFMKAYYGFRMTLAMGDIPYSEAGRATEGITQPAYDKQEDVFKQIVEDLGKAEALFGQGQAFDGDIMYGGDALKWQKLCNMLRLKVLQTKSRKATSEDKALFAQIVNSSKLMESNPDNFKLSYSTNDNARYPFWNGNSQQTWVAPSELCVNTLKKYNDRRLFYFAEPSAAEMAKDAANVASDWEMYVGAPTELSSEQLAVNNASGMYSLINLRYPKFQDGDPMLIYTYSEQCFIIAEAIESGWLSGNAKSYYENGVKAMLEYYRDLPNTKQPDYVHGMAIDDAYIAGYFTEEAAYKTDGSTTDRLHQIWDQRWLIDFFQGRPDYYYQFLRTGWPEYPLDPSTNMNPEDKATWPKRWMYPTSEKTTNPDNYQKAIDDQYGGYDSLSQLPWYLK